MITKQAVDMDSEAQSEAMRIQLNRCCSLVRETLARSFQTD